MDFSKYEKYVKQEKPKISEETAFEQFNILVESHGLKLEDIKKNKDQCDFIVNAIMDGFLQVEETPEGEVEITQFLKRRSTEGDIEKLVYGEIKQLDKQSMKKDSQEYKKITELLGSMCKTPHGALIIAKLKSYDSKVIESLGILFL